MSPPENEHQRRQQATREAFGVAIGAFILAALLLIIGYATTWSPDGATSTTTTVVTKEPTTTNTNETKSDSTPSPAPTSKTDGEQTTTPGQETTVVTTDGDQSFLGQLFRNPATTLLLQLLAALAFAFLAGAAWQRIRLGYYGIQIGSLSIQEIPIDEKATEQLRDTIHAEDVQTILEVDIIEPRPRWWYLVPDEIDIDALKLERIAVEAGTRDLAQSRGLEQQIEYTPMVWDLLDQRREGQSMFSAQFGAGLIRLVSIGDRLIAGAAIDDDARIDLADANRHALDVLFSYLPPAG
ncbi:hypothetical protein [Leifsonia sp. 21MFCrub1.1]|uniref:hypothetical protein n=1 Tax=Leifsonia sp. 21MFCrub1.1 TaxID=1798223 RepID=UPI00089295AE|nr:hypothetical protein [Leifsonia sp. 21MFCrub1.1]SEA40397.1 hypothetical protein SAMN04515680_0243 [Leifsonia sp. 21MFCrub1.1]